MPNHLKKLDGAALARLKVLEDRTGKCVVAFEVSPKLDDVSEAELKEIRSTEKEMNAVLVAYACPVDNL